jgi:hypothetical protein
VITTPAALTDAHQRLAAALFALADGFEQGNVVLRDAALIKFDPKTAAKGLRASAEMLRDIWGLPRPEVVM